MGKHRPTHFKRVESFDTDHGEGIREMTAAALYEAHHDHGHAEHAIRDVIEKRREDDE